MILQTYPKYITGSLRESCKILIKGFNKEFLPGSLTEHPVHHLEHLSVGMCVTSYSQDSGDPCCLAEILLGCCGLVHIYIYYSLN